MMTQELTPQIVLASQSPRRTELLSLTRLPFTNNIGQIDESPRAGETPTYYTRRIAREKAAAAIKVQNGACLVLAADTIVAHNGVIMGKPIDDEDANRMLTKLDGKTHTVITAIAIAWSGKSYDDCCSTQVQFRRFSQQERSDYVSSGDPLDKAGAYGIQNSEFRPATTLGGCLANVMGLPLCHVARGLAAVGVALTTNIAAACMEHTCYECPVHQNIFAE